MKVKFKQWDCIAQGAHYANNNKAVRLIDVNTAELVATATVNLIEETIDDDKAFIKEYSENEGMTLALVEAGIINMTVHGTVQTGHVTVDLHRFTVKALKELW